MTSINPVNTISVSNLDWNEYEQGLVLGAFYWCHWSTQVAGGVLAQRFGTKRVFGLSQLATVTLALLIPTAAKYGHKTLITLRVVQGIASVSYFILNLLINFKLKEEMSVSQGCDFKYTN